MPADIYVREQELPHISFILPISASETDAEDFARKWINDRLDIKCYEIMHVELINEGMMKTKDGPVFGRAYMVAFMRTEEQIIFIHPDYDKIINRK